MNNPDFNYKKGYVFCNQNVESNHDKITYLPIYMIDFVSKPQTRREQIIRLDISILI